MSEMYEKQTNEIYDELIASIHPVPDVVHVTALALSAPASYKRGALLDKASTGKYVLHGKGATGSGTTYAADAILAEDVTVGTDDTVVLVYRTGHFREDTVAAKSKESNGGTTVEITDGDRAALRDVGILLTKGFAY